mmetsp:Transcript_17240/g.48091  ORF Transcript_17240/g.48091 Transcript_17240/m.48091 type:complete len:287 (+) Transcript_17240:213-1073(+)
MSGFSVWHFRQRVRLAKLLNLQPGQLQSPGRVYAGAPAPSGLAVPQLMQAFCLAKLYWLQSGQCQEPTAGMVSGRVECTVHGLSDLHLKHVWLRAKLWQAHAEHIQSPGFRFVEGTPDGSMKAGSPSLRGMLHLKHSMRLLKLWNRQVVHTQSPGSRLGSSFKVWHFVQWKSERSFSKLQALQAQVSWGTESWENPLTAGCHGDPDVHERTEGDDKMFGREEILCQAAASGRLGLLPTPRSARGESRWESDRTEGAQQAGVFRPMPHARRPLLRATPIIEPKYILA